MKHRNPLFVLFIVFAIVNSAIPSFSAQHKKDEVNSLISETESKLLNVRNAQNADLFRYEISKIENYISSSKNLISTGKIDPAYYEINIGILYFQMIDARLELHNAMIELDASKK